MVESNGIIDRKRVLLYILSGQDDFSLHQSLDEIKRDIGDQTVIETSTTTLDGQQVTLDQLRNICETVPFFSEKRLVIIKGLLERLEEAGVTVVHSPLDCASVLLYDHFREELGREAGRMAAFAAWADQFEDGPLAEALLRDYDRQSVQLEGLLLAYALINQPSEEFRNFVAGEISDLNLPHRMEGVLDAATAHLEDMSMLVESLKESAVRLGELAYVEGTDKTPIGSVAGIVTDALGVNVGLCYKEKGDLVNISIRSRRGLSFHLGEITRQIATRNGGFGGGHKRASGASIPSGSLGKFIGDLEEALRSS